MIVFRVGAFDAEVLEKEFMPQFTAEDLVNLGIYQIYLKLMIDGISSSPFSATTIPPIAKPEHSSMQNVIEMSRQQFAHTREEVEKNIADWMAPIKPPEKPKVQPQPAPAAPPVTQPKPIAPKPATPPPPPAPKPQSPAISKPPVVEQPFKKAFEAVKPVNLNSLAPKQNPKQASPQRVNELKNALASALAGQKSQPPQQPQKQPEQKAPQPQDHKTKEIPEDVLKQVLKVD
jgi:hypothetical protein